MAKYINVRNIFIIFLLAAGFLLLWFLPANKLVTKTPQVNNQPTQNKIISAKSFSYRGEEGVDALTLLKKQTEVEEKQPGFVTSVNGYSASSEKKEFWSFYVNGKMADRGAGEYVTKDTDLIEWKIENY